MRAPFAIAALLFAVVALAQEHPKLDAPVTDRTGTLTSAQVAALRAKIDALEARKGSQIVVLVVSTTQPETIEQYAVATFAENAIGRRGVDDGVLLLVAKDDRRVRIETGYGLEGSIPDAVANRVIAEYLTPKFRAGDFHGGIDDAVTALAKVIEGEALPAPLARTPSAKGGGVSEAVFFGGIIGIVLGGFLGAVRAGRRAPIVAAIAAIVLFMKFLVLPAAIGTGAAAITSVLGGSRGRFAGGGRAWRGTGGWGGGGWGGGGGGFGGGGGGWSGGGGRSGGGGASGGW